MFLKLIFTFFVPAIVNILCDDFSRGLQLSFPEFDESLHLPKRVYELPEDLYPLRYDLYVVPRLENDFYFTGTVVIRIFMRETVPQIALHSQGLNIENVNITNSEAREIQNTFSLNDAKGMLIISANRQLYSKYEYDVTIKFNGKINDQNIGFYRSSYINGDNNQKKWLAVTQFKPTYARMAFPCFDEPKYKTPFQLRLARYPHQTAISNMPLESTSSPDSEIDNRVWDTFQTTPPIPTYLIAFMVSNLHGKTNGKTSIRSRKGTLGYTKYALQESESILHRMELLTGVSCDLSKLDLVAVPDFSFGLIDGFGLTTCRERRILADEENSSERHLQLVTRSVAHGIANQWFGGYVTHFWWSYAWLSEGFATYFEYFATAEEKPDWRLEEYFVVNALQNALSIDGVKIRHRLTIFNYAETTNVDIFDTITYNKGASIIRMMEHIVSGPTFFNILNNYLKNNKEKNVRAYHLWQSLESESEESALPSGWTLERLMESWTMNQGYALLTLNRTESGQIVLTQETYQSVRAEMPVPTGTWRIPVSYTTKSKIKQISTMPTVWVMSSKPEIIEEDLTNTDWILCNLRQTGYYRVNYDISNWNLLVDQLHQNPQTVEPLNRAQLIDDSFNLAFDEKLPFNIPLRLAAYLATETDPIPWITGLRQLNYLYAYFETSTIEPVVKEYIASIIEKPYRYFGFNVRGTDAHLAKILKPSMASFVCQLKLADCAEKAMDEYWNHKNDSSEVQADVKSLVFCIVLENLRGAALLDAWDNLWALYGDTELDYERETILAAMGCLKDEVYLKMYLYKLLDPKNNKLRKHQMKLASHAISNSIASVSSAVHFINDILTKENGNLESDNIDTLVDIANEIKDRIQTEDQLEDLAATIRSIGKLDLKKFKDLLKVLTEAYNKRVVKLNKRNIISDIVLSSLISVIEVSASIKEYSISKKKKKIQNKDKY